MKTHKVNVEDLQVHIDAINKFNRLALKDIQLYKEGKKINIPSKLLKQFEYTGLANIDLVKQDFWKTAIIIYKRQESAAKRRKKKK